MVVEVESNSASAWTVGSAPRTLVGIKELVDSLSLSRSTIYRLMDNEGFPKPVKLTVGIARWKVSEVDAWVADAADRRRMH